MHQQILYALNDSIENSVCDFLNFEIFLNIKGDLLAIGQVEHIKIQVYDFAKQND